MTDEDRFYIAEARRLATLEGISDYGLAFSQARIVLEKLADIAERLSQDAPAGRTDR
jgi:hypothetical protein